MAAATLLEIVCVFSLNIFSGAGIAVTMTFFYKSSVADFSCNIWRIRIMPVICQTLDPTFHFDAYQVLGCYLFSYLFLQ